MIGVDIAPSALAQQQRLTSCCLVQCDMLALSFRDSSFDLVIDKGAIDAMLCSQQASNNITVDAVLAQVERLLRPGGVFISVTCEGPAARKSMLERAASSFCQMSVAKVPKSERNQLNGSRLHYIYAATTSSCDTTAPAQSQRKRAAETGLELEDDLLQAIIGEDTVRLAKLIASGASVMYVQSSVTGVTPCMVAAGVGSVECLQILSGVNHTIHSCYPMTPLSFICHHLSVA